MESILHANAKKTPRIRDEMQIQQRNAHEAHKKPLLQLKQMPTSLLIAKLLLALCLIQ